MEKETNQTNVKKHGGWRKCLAVGLTLTLVVGGGAYAYGQMEFNDESVVEYVELNSANTVFDEALTSYNQNVLELEQYSIEDSTEESLRSTAIREDISTLGLAERLDYYETIIDLSDELYDLDISSELGTIEPTNVSEMNYSIEQIYSMIETYRDYKRNGVSANQLSEQSEEFIFLAKTLAGYEIEINSIIRTDALRDIANYKILRFKSAVADCVGCDVEEINNMTISNGDTNGYHLSWNAPSGQTYTVTFNEESFPLYFLTSGNIVNREINSIFNDQSYANGIATIPGSDTEIRSRYGHSNITNNYVRSEINGAKTLTRVGFEINDNNLELNGSLAIQKAGKVFKKTKNESTETE